MLSPGELVEATEAHYRPNSLGLHKVGGKAKQYGGSTRISGMAYLAFDGVADRLLVHEGTTWKSTTVSGSSSTTHKTGRTVGQRLTSTHYENFYIVADGASADSQHVFSTGMATAVASAGIYPFGLKPPAIGGGGLRRAYQITSNRPEYVSSWNISTYPGSGYGTWGAKGQPMFYYWATEYVSALNMESSVTSMRFTTYGSNTASTLAGQRIHGFDKQGTNFRLLMPTATTNAETTHRRIYRATNSLLGSELMGRDIMAQDAVGTPGITDRITCTAGSVPLVGELIATIAASTTSYVDWGLYTGLPFASITADVLGIALTSPRDELPPQHSTGDIFQDSFVCNDLANKHLVRYSFPGKPWSFPGFYYLNPSFGLRDEVTLVRSLGDITIVGMKNSLIRVNYLPRETDPEFNRGKAMELIARQGVVGPYAADLFSMEGTTPMLAVVSRSGIWLTDGYRIREATRDIDWENTVNQDALETCQLINVPHLWSLILYYPPKGETENTKAFYLSYHPLHMKDGGYLPVTGPVTMADATGTTYNGRARLKQAVYGSNNRLYTAMVLSATA